MFEIKDYYLRHASLYDLLQCKYDVSVEARPLNSVLQCRLLIGKQQSIVR